MQSMASTYSGHDGDPALDKGWVSKEIAEGVSTTQLAVGVGTVTTTPGAEGCVVPSPPLLRAPRRDRCEVSRLRLSTVPAFLHKEAETVERFQP